MNGSTSPSAIRSYDLVFSLGYDCNASLALRRAGLQFRSHPFDWLTRAPLAPRADLLARRFQGWLAPDALEDLGAATFDRFARRHRVVLDRPTGLELRHDFPLELSVADGLPDVAAKYARRADRLLADIKRAHRALAVFCVGFRFPNLPLDDLVAAHDRLCTAFGDKIDVLGVADDNPDGPDRPPHLESACGGHVVRASIRCLSHTPQGIEVNERRVADFLRATISAPDPRTPAEKRAYRDLLRRRAREKYAAKTWLGMVWNRLLFRRYRSLMKKLQKKGLLPPNEPGAPQPGGTAS